MEALSSSVAPRVVIFDSEDSKLQPFKEGITAKYGITARSKGNTFVQIIPKQACKSDNKISILWEMTVKDLSSLNAEEMKSATPRSGSGSVTLMLPKDTDRKTLTVEHYRTGEWVDCNGCVTSTHPESVDCTMIKIDEYTPMHLRPSLTVNNAKIKANLQSIFNIT